MNNSTPLEKPVIGEYAKLSAFVSDQLAYLKKTDANFSVLRACKSFRRLSPTLISLITREKRKLTIDRTDEVAKLLRLSLAEKIYLRDWVERSEAKRPRAHDECSRDVSERSRKKNVSLNILNDWLNVYVKDCFQLKDVQENPLVIYSHLAHVADRKRIDKCIQFLLKEGYLRKTLDKKTVVETHLAIAETPVASHKIRQFHKAALSIARNSIETVPMDKRHINTLVLPLTGEKYAEFIEIIHEFAERVKDFSAGLDAEDSDSLYQFNLSLVPTGRKDA